MSKVLKKIVLDLKNDELYGFQEYCRSEDIIDYVYRNINGEKAPKVEVVKVNGIYQLSLGFPKRRPYRRYFNYGGHHRSVAHDISDNLLKCYLMNEHEEPETAERMNFLKIQDISLKSNGFFLYNWHKNTDSLNDYFGFLKSSRNKLNIFDNKILEKFVEHHDLNLEDSEKLYDFLLNLKVS